MNRDKLILLVGASGSGKTTIARSLEDIGYNIIHSYTTRKPRYDGEWGHTFVDKPNIENQVDWIKFKYSSDKIACEELYGEYYWATKEQYMGKGISIYIIDPVGALDVQHRLEDEVETVIIYLNCSEKERELRMNLDDREADDIMNRLVRDKHLFSTVKCNYVVDADNSKSNIITSIVGIIESM